MDRSTRRHLERLLKTSTHIIPAAVGQTTAEDFAEAVRRRQAELWDAAPHFRQRMNRRLFALGIPVLALYRTLMEDFGVEQARALELVDELLQATYRRIFASPMSRRLFGASFKLRVLREQVLHAAEQLNEPGGFRMQRVDSPEHLLALDVHDCALVRFFVQQGTPELGPLVCKIDDVMAHAADVDLERTGTIATGAARCDFRYRSKDPEAS